jgi:hypothetical protein
MSAGTLMSLKFVIVIGFLFTPFYSVSSLQTNTPQAAQTDQRPRQAPGLFLIVRNGKVGFIDRAGKIVIEPQFEMAEQFSDGLAQVTFSTPSAIRPISTHSFIDSKGNIVIRGQFLQTFDFSEGLALVQDVTGLYGFIDKEGRWAIKPQFDDARGGGFREGFAGVAMNGRWGFINKEGKAVIDFQFNHAGDFSEGLTWVGIRGKAGYVDTSGRMVIQPHFDQAFDFSEGLAAVRLGAKFV